MKLKSIFEKSAYGTIAFIDTEEHFKVNKQHFDKIKHLLYVFPYIIVVTNRNESSDSTHQDAYHALYDQVHDSVIHVKLPYNKGHTYGTMQMDNLLFSTSKQNNLPVVYIVKSSSDMVFDETMFDVQIPDDLKDFYFYSSFGYGSCINEDKPEFIQSMTNGQNALAQSLFYIMTSKAPSIYGEVFVDAIMELNKKAPHMKPWELYAHIGKPLGHRGFSSEELLESFVKKNQLTTCNLLSESVLNKLHDFVLAYKVVDGSWKNVCIKDVGNLCHHHYHDKPQFILG